MIKKEEWNDYIEKYLSNNVNLQEIENNISLNLNTILAYVKNNSDFYSKRIQNLDKIYSNQNILEIWKKIPFTTKADLREAGESVCCMPFNDIVVYYETTGTTGKATPCPRADIDISTSNAYVKKSVSKIYKNTFKTTHALTAIMGPSELYAFGDTYGEVCRDLEIPFIKLWPESPRVGIKKAANLILKLGVKVLICSPAIALALIRFYKKKNIDFRKIKVKQILLLGELCTQEMLNNISKLWDANCTHGLYGSQEIHALATGGVNGELNISETNYFLETIPIEGIINGIGELCVTMLVPGAKPLVRFRTGDAVKIYRNSELDEARKIYIYGRVDDIIEINGKKFLPADIEIPILQTIPLLSNYKVEIKKIKNEEKLEIFIISETSKINIDNVEKKLSKIFGIPTKLNIIEELDEKTEMGAYVSWKYARICDRRK